MKRNNPIFRINIWLEHCLLTFKKRQEYYKGGKQRGNMAQPLTAIDVAKYLLYKANSDGDLITNLKMQKLLYYAQAWYLVNFSKPLFQDPIKAWKFGPIVETAYYHFKRFGLSPIICNDAEKIIPKIHANIRDYLDEYYKIYIQYSASDLTQMSHNEAPWRETPQSKEIPLDLIADFYKKQYIKYIEKKDKKIT